MQNLVIDNEYLNNTAKKMEFLINELQKVTSSLKDEKADIFDRFIAFNFSICFLTIIHPIIEANKLSMMGGHVLQNKIFHTEICKKKGWYQYDISRYPFFKNETDDTKESRDEIIKDFLGAVIDKIKNS